TVISKDETEVNQGCFSYSLVHSNLGISKSEACRLKMIAWENAFSHFVPQFHEGLDNVFPADQEVSMFIRGYNKAGYGEVHPFLMRNKQGNWGIRSCDLVSCFIP